MSNELATTEQPVDQLIDVSQFGVAKYFDEDAFEEISKSSFLPRLQLCGGNSDLVKELKVGITHYALVTTKNDPIIDLGTVVDVIPISVRLAAIDLGGESIVSCYNPESALYKSIMAKSEEADSKAMYGPQFLVWVPAAKQFASFLFGAKSTRKEARNMRPLMGKGARLSSKLITTPGYKWHVPIVTPSNTTLEAPPTNKVAIVAKTFNSPDESAVEFNPDANPAPATGSDAGEGRAR